MNDRAALVDALREATLAVPGVAALTGGRYGAVSTYLPGRRVEGVRIGAELVEIQVIAGWGTHLPGLAGAILDATRPLVELPVEVTIADIHPNPHTSQE